MTWREQKHRAFNSINELNIQAKDLVFNIRESMGWKTVYFNNNNISEGFKTWREVAIFLSGMRTGRQYAI